MPLILIELHLDWKKVMVELDSSKKQVVAALHSNSKEDVFQQKIVHLNGLNVYETPISPPT